MMRRRIFVALMLAVALVFAIGAPASAVEFTDTAGSPFEDSIELLAERAIVGGYSDGTFRPDNVLQRQQFAKMAVLTMGYEVTLNDVSSFPDTPAPFDPVNNPLYPGSYVAVAAENEIILGKTDGTFDFYGNVTRQQAITIVVRAAGETLAEPDAGYQGDLSYQDPDHGANIKKAEFNGLLEGIPNLASWNPAAPATRGEAAELLAQLLALVEARLIDPLVSTDWLETNLDMGGLVIIDTRAADVYAAGHIPGSINIPAGFYTNTDPEDMAPGQLYMELPTQADLFALLGNNGITPDSVVVVVGGYDPLPTYGLADATRVADTLIYAGVKNVAVLDGAYPKWVADGKTVTTDVPTVTPVTYTATVDSDMWVSTEYVHDHIGEVLIIDARDAEVYNGTVTEPWATKPGHIPTAVSLPAPLIWEEDWTYKPADALEQLAAAAFTADSDEEIILYCGVGGYESSWWYVLTQILGYTNVKLYDGAAQAWAAEYDMEM
jgi:thiosulfate/3-mercaptopyruvate sulfurtransferase